MKHAAISAAVRGADVAVAVAVVAAVADTNRTVVAASCVCVVVVAVVAVAVVVGKMAGDPALTHARYFAYIRCVSMH